MADKPLVRFAHAPMCALLVILWTIPALVGAQPARTPAPPATPSAGATEELSKFAQAWAGVTAYSATVTVFEQKGTQVQNVVFDYSFRKPANATVHVASGPDAGVTLVWAGGETVVARRGTGFAALFRKTFGLHDPLATTIRGSSIDELSFGAILARAQQDAGILSEEPGAQIDGVGVSAVTLIPSGPTTEVGLTRESIDISTATNLPVRVLGFDGGTLVRKIEFSDVKVTE
jgi:outer membrane lipoprotein-sorting protein